MKKLHRMLNGGIAQAAAQTWKSHTLFLLAIIFAAHIACFIVLTSLIDGRHS
jgi:hypothetical protein